MFWDAVGGGLVVLTHWQTYVAVLLFFALTFGPMVVLSQVAMASGKASAPLGCLSALVLPIFQVFALCVFVATLLPILLGFSHDASWSLPWLIVSSAPGHVLLLVGKLLVAAVVLAVIPLIGRINSVYTAVIGGLALIVVLGIVAKGNPNLDVSGLRLWPGMWFSVGLIVVGAAMGWLGAICAAMAAVAIDAKFEGMGQVVATPLAATFGFLPLFIYAAWLGNQLHRL